MIIDDKEADYEKIHSRRSDNFGISRKYDNERQRSKAENKK